MVVMDWSIPNDGFFKSRLSNRATLNASNIQIKKRSLAMLVQAVAGGPLKVSLN